MLTVYLEHDLDLENPAEPQDDTIGHWQVYSFCRSHVNFKHPDALGIDVTNDGIKFSNPELQRGIEQGLAFALSYYEHGRSSWFLKGQNPEGAEFTWDGVRVAGLLVWIGPEEDLGPKTIEDREQDAKNFLEVYTIWANGEGYYYRIENSQGETLDSCGGFYDSDTMLDDVAEELIGCYYTIEGTADYLSSQLEAKVDKLNKAKAKRLTEDNDG